MGISHSHGCCLPFACSLTSRFPAQRATAYASICNVSMRSQDSVRYKSNFGINYTFSAENQREQLKSNESVCNYCQHPVNVDQISNSACLNENGNGCSLSALDPAGSRDLSGHSVRNVQQLLQFEQGEEDNVFASSFCWISTELMLACGQGDNWPYSPQQALQLEYPQAGFLPTVDILLFAHIHCS